MEGMPIKILGRATLKWISDIKNFLIFRKNVELSKKGIYCAPNKEILYKRALKKTRGMASLLNNKTYRKESLFRIWKQKENGES